MKTWNDAIDEAIELLSSYTTVWGDCSASVLRRVHGATPSNQLYIDRLKTLYNDGEDYKEGLVAAITTLERNEIGRENGVAKLIPVLEPAQYMSLYISRLQAVLFNVTS